MALFKKAENTSAYLKAGFLGFAGSGKTYTATQLAIGLCRLMAEKQLKEAGKPIFFIDTETGSDYVTHKVREAGLEIFTAKTRAYVDLIAAINECEKEGAVLIIDSITHFWREFVESYQRRKDVNRLDFQDWNFLKGSDGWGQFTDRYVNSACHIIMCGRAGYEYETETNSKGKKEQVKAGVKMKAETETGFEPSLLVLMEREMNLKTNVVNRTAYVLKERFDLIDGKEFANPTFENFLPHIQMLNLGGAQLGVDSKRNSDAMFTHDGDDTKWKYEQRQKDIALEEIKEEINKHVGYGQDAETKKAKGDLLEKVSNSRAWANVEGRTWPAVKMVRDALWMVTRGHPYGGTPMVEESNEIPHEPKTEAA